jgi:hypothetical protein
MLNPSTADEHTDDPTLRRVVAFSRMWGYDELVVVNLYPYISSDPREAALWADWETSHDWCLRDQLFTYRDFVAAVAKKSALVVAAWGAGAWDSYWAESVVDAVQEDLPPYPDLYCLGETASGAPKHPLARGRHRIPDDQQPVLWRSA